jgi:hypothetical protein
MTFINTIFYFDNNVCDAGKTCDKNHSGRLVGFMVSNATFNNISVILWWSVLLVDETGRPSNSCKERVHLVFQGELL